MSESREEPKRRNLVKWIAGLLLVIALVVGGASILATRRFEAMIEVGKTAQAQYGALNREFAFEKPSVPATERLEAMLKVRGNLWQGLDPRARAALTETLNAASLNALIRHAPGLLGLGEALDAGLKRHLAALREQRMSADEYLWLLGLAVDAALRSRNAAGAGYRSVMERIEEMSRADSDPDNDLTVRQMTDELQRRCNGVRLDAPWVNGRLEAVDPAAYALDLLALAAPDTVDFERPGSLMQP